MDDPDENVREFAVCGLRRFVNAPAVIERILGATKDPSELVRKQAREMLGEIYTCEGTRPEVKERIKQHMQELAGELEEKSAEKG